jgi:hypothetical protein
MLMKRVWGHVLAGLSLIAGAAPVFSACVHNDSTIFVRDVLAPQTSSQSGALCLYTADPAQAFISSGTLDYALRPQYDAIFLVGNQMVPEVNANQLQTETSTVTIQGAIVRITDRGGKQIGNYTRLAAATLSPSSGNTPGYAPIGVTIVDATTLGSAPAGSEIQQVISGPLQQSGTVRLVTYVRFFGVTLGGRSVESDEFEFPVDVCNGCLIRFSDNPRFPTPNCVGNAASAGSTATQPVVPCLFGQDVAIDCNLVCQDLPTCNANTQGVAIVDAGSG